MTDSNNPMLAGALDYAKRGWAVLPVQANGKAPLGKLVPHGFLHATTNPKTLQQWWTIEPTANIGIRTGAISDLFVFDIDPRNGGNQSLSTLEAQYGRLPETLQALTGGGGRHLYFVHPGGCLASHLGLPGVDIKADGGYVVAPPSRHASGGIYSWKEGAGPTTKALSLLPQWLLERLRSIITTASGRSLSEWRTVAMQGIAEGQRNIWVTRLAGHLLGHRIDPIVSLDLILAWNQVHNRPPLPQDEVIKTVDAIAGRELRRRQGGPRHG